MRYFWNVVTDYVKTKNDKAIVEKTFEEAFAMCAEQAANAQFAGKKYLYLIRRGSVKVKYILKIRF